MTYHVYYIDKTGQPYAKVQMDDEKEAIAMLKRHVDHGGKRLIAEVARFDVGGFTVDGVDEPQTVIIFRVLH